MSRFDRLRQLKKEIYRIAGEHNAEKVYVFGSCARKEDTPESDVDFIAGFRKHATLFDHAGLEYDLAQLLGCRVDVVAEDALKDDAFAAGVRKDMVLL